MIYDCASRPLRIATSIALEVVKVLLLTVVVRLPNASGGEFRLPYLVHGTSVIVELRHGLATSFVSLDFHIGVRLTFVLKSVLDRHAFLRIYIFLETEQNTISAYASQVKILVRREKHPAI